MLTSRFITISGSRLSESLSSENNKSFMVEYIVTLKQEKLEISIISDPQFRQLFGEVQRLGIVDDSKSAKKIKELTSTLLNGLLDKTIKMKDLKSSFKMD